MNFNNAHSVDVDGIAKSLYVDLTVGLKSDEEIKELTEQYGSNVHAPVKPRSIC